MLIWVLEIIVCLLHPCIAQTIRAEIESNDLVLDYEVPDAVAEFRGRRRSGDAVAFFSVLRNRLTYSVVDLNVDLHHHRLCGCCEIKQTIVQVLFAA